MRVLDRYGCEIERERVRRAMGFREQMLPEGEPETLNGVQPAPGNVERVHWDSKDGAREDVR